MAIDSGRDINSSINGAGALAVDASGVNGLKRAAHQNPNSPEAIKGVAKQFEAMFLNMMMKSMRQATPQDGPFDSEQSKMFTTMLDQQMSQSMAQRGVGLADVLTRQLTPGLSKSPADPGQGAESAGMTSLPFGADRLRQDSQQDDGAGAFGAALPINKKLMAAD